VDAFGGRGGRTLTDAGARLVAPVAQVDPAVDARLVHVGDRVVGGAGTGGPVRAAPAVARGVDQHADVAVEALRDELLTVGLNVGHLVDEVVPVDPAARHFADGLAAHHVVDVEVRLLESTVVRGVRDEAVHVVDGGAVAGRRLEEQVGRRPEV